MATALKTAPEGHIVKTPGVRGGRACVGGTRVTVADLVYLHKWSKTADEMRVYYSDRPLTLGEVYAALSYYYDHVAEIEAEIAAQDEWDADFERRKALHLAKKSGT